MPPRAAGLAVGDSPQPHRFLERDRIAEALALHRAQCGAVDLAARTRASGSAAGRRRFPTWSARNGSVAASLISISFTGREKLAGR